MGFGRVLGWAVERSIEDTSKSPAMQYVPSNIPLRHLLSARYVPKDMKLRYYELMIKLALQEDNYLDACKAWQEVWDTEEVKNNEQQNLQVSSSIPCVW